MNKEELEKFISDAIAESKKLNLGFNDDQHHEVAFKKIKLKRAYSNEQLEQISELVSELLKNNK